MNHDHDRKIIKPNHSSSSRILNTSNHITSSTTIVHQHREPQQQQRNNQSKLTYNNNNKTISQKTSKINHDVDNDDEDETDSMFVLGHEDNDNDNYNNKCNNNNNKNLPRNVLTTTITNQKSHVASTMITNKNNIVKSSSSNYLNNHPHLRQNDSNKKHNNSCNNKIVNNSQKMTKKSISNQHMKSNDRKQQKSSIMKTRDSHNIKKKTTNDSNFFRIFKKSKVVNKNDKAEDYDPTNYLFNLDKFDIGNDDNSILHDNDNNSDDDSSSCSCSSNSIALSEYIERRYKIEDNELDQAFIPPLIMGSYHLPDYTWNQDLYQYLSNNHPLFGICCHHPRHPITGFTRIATFIGSASFGLAITNVIYLAFVFTNTDYNHIYYQFTPNSNNNVLSDDFVQSLVSVTNGNIALWTAGVTIHAIYDNTVWSLAACVCFMDPGMKVTEKMKRYKKTGSYLVLLCVIIVLALTTFVVTIRAALDSDGDGVISYNDTTSSSAQTPSNVLNSIDNINGLGNAFNNRINDNNNNNITSSSSTTTTIYNTTDDDDFSGMNFTTGTAVSDISSGTIDTTSSSSNSMKGHKFDFLLAYCIELILTYFIYYPIIGTILFSGILTCGKYPIIGGRPYEIKQEQLKQQRKQLRKEERRNNNKQQNNNNNRLSKQNNNENNNSQLPIISQRPIKNSYNEANKKMQQQYVIEINDEDDDDDDTNEDNTIGVIEIRIPNTTTIPSDATVTGISV